MPKKPSEDPAVSLNVTVRQSVFNRIEKARGPVKRSTWVEMACEEKLNNISAITKLVAAGKLTAAQAQRLLEMKVS